MVRTGQTNRCGSPASQNMTLHFCCKSVNFDATDREGGLNTGVPNWFFYVCRASSKNKRRRKVPKHMHTWPTCMLSVKDVDLSRIQNQSKIIPVDFSRPVPILDTNFSPADNCRGIFKSIYVWKKHHCLTDGFVVLHYIWIHLFITICFQKTSILTPPGKNGRRK